jgi:hypothetical protein
MQELELTDGRIVRVWWLLTWRSFAGAFVGGFVSFWKMFSQATICLRAA